MDHAKNSFVIVSLAIANKREHYPQNSRQTKTITRIIPAGEQRESINRAVTA
jgi:hypothetical protein